MVAPGLAVTVDFAVTSGLVVIFVVAPGLVVTVDFAVAPGLVVGGFEELSCFVFGLTLL